MYTPVGSHVLQLPSRLHVMIQSKKPNTTAMRKKARKRPYKKGGKKKRGEVDKMYVVFFCIFLFYSYAFLYYIRNVYHFFTKNCLMKKSGVRRSLRIIQWKNQTLGLTQVLLKRVQN
jgi:hypothetical protein